MTKVAFIGVDSIEFSRPDVIDLCAAPELGPLELALHDTDPDRLDHAGAVARAIARQSGAPVTVDTCPQRAAALDGAGYVVCELEVGGIAATRLDFEIPARYGVRQATGDTLGIGGIFRGLRTLPVMVDLARDMATRCPRACLLTYTNPMAMSTWAVCEATGLPHVYGLCHSVEQTHELLAALVGVPVDGLDVLSAGLNHQAFVLRLAHRGESLYPRLAEALERDPGPADPVAVELFRRFGYFPSLPAAEYLPWIMRHDAERARLRVDLDGHEPGEAENLRDMAADRRRVAAGHPLELAVTGAPAAGFIQAMSTGGERELYASVPNRGLVTNLPARCCVEVPCRIAHGAATPVPVGALPVQLAALNRTFLNVAELTVRAVLDGDRGHVHHAALLDPNTAATLTVAQTAAMCDELLAAHRDLLPAGLVG